MSAIDLIILIPIAFGAYKGFKEGLLMELVTLIAFILATVLSFKLWKKAVDFLSPYITKNESILPVLGFLLVFVVVLIVVFLIGKSLKAILNMTLLGTFDNAAGAVVGALKWAFGFSTVLWLMESAGIGLPYDWVNESVIYPYFVAYGPKLIEWFSMLVPYAKDLIEQIKDIVKINP
jgi:membrane protein required for colicin V production